MTAQSFGLIKSDEKHIHDYVNKPSRADEIKDVIKKQAEIEKSLTKLDFNALPMSLHRCGFGYIEKSEERVYRGHQHYSELCFLHKALERTATQPNSDDIMIDALYLAKKDVRPSPEELCAHLTTMQWLGSPVGLSIVKSVLEDVGYEVKMKK